uniref:uncharacterized protein n=1 Tax=Semicossyphus pulcher TaxID=241346 RepID=UPI0037E8B578
MSVQFCLALLALSSLTAASDQECDELIKPLQDRSRISGKWIFFAGTADHNEVLEELKMITSSWIEFSPEPDSEDVVLHYGDKMNGECHHGKANFTFTGNTTKVTFYPNGSTREHLGKHLVTCPDCVMWTDDSVSEGQNKETRRARNLYLFTKSGKLDAAQLEVLKKQAACLNLLSEFHFGKATDLCPDNKAEEEPSSAQTN